MPRPTAPQHNDDMPKALTWHAPPHRPTLRVRSLHCLLRFFLIGASTALDTLGAQAYGGSPWGPMEGEAYGMEISLWLSL